MRCLIERGIIYFTLTVTSTIIIIIIIIIKVLIKVFIESKDKNTYLMLQAIKIKNDLQY